MFIIHANVSQVTTITDLIVDNVILYVKLALQDLHMKENAKPVKIYHIGITHLLIVSVMMDIMNP